MPSIDYSGRYFAFGRCTDKGSRGAIRFPIKASTNQAARNFANKMVLELLPGWGRGTVELRLGDKDIGHWVLRR